MFSGRNPVTLMNLRLRAQYFLGGTAFRCPALWLCLSTFAGAAAVTDNHRIRATAALLASPQDGEVLGAARALCRLFGKQGLEPADVVGAGLVKSLSTSTSAQPAPVSILRQHQVGARQCLAYPNLLSDRELEFLGNIAAARAISDKQFRWLQTIAAKVERARR